MPNISNEIVTFCAGNAKTSDFITAFQDYYVQTREMRDGLKLFAYDTNVSYDEKSKKISDAFFAEVEARSGVKRTADNISSWCANPNVKWAAMAVIDATINSVLPLTINPSIGAFTDLKFVSYGDIVHYTIKPRTLYTVSLGAHGERTTHRQLKASGDLIVTPKEHIVTVYADMFSVLSGKQDLADFVRLVVMSVETEMTKDIMSALTTGMAQGTYPAALSIQGAFNTQTLINLAETVQAYNYGSRPVIMGTASALAQVVPDSAIGARINVDGLDGSISILKNFYGYTLIQLPQVATGDYTNFSLAMDPDTVYVISPAMDKVVKTVVSNTLTNSNQFYDNADLTSNYTFRKDWDAVFASAAFAGMYKITG